MPRGRPRGSKNANTARKELEELARVSSLGQGVDPSGHVDAHAAVVEATLVGVGRMEPDPNRDRDIAHLR